MSKPPTPQPRRSRRWCSTSSANIWSSSARSVRARWPLPGWLSSVPRLRRRKLASRRRRCSMADIRPELILAFLDHLEHERNNTVRSRNLRLTALRAFLKFAARHDVASLHVIERALAVPMKRFERPMLGFLTRAGDAGGARATGRELVLAARPPAAGHALQHRRAGLRDHRRARG